MVEWKIGNISVLNRIVIAPMAGISNGAFRELCFKNGAGLVYTEMVSDKAIVYDNKKTRLMIDIADQYHPVSVQLFGSDIDSMVKAAVTLDTTNADIIDINMGCPVNKVVKSGSGSALMLDEKKAVAIAEAIVKAVRKPVTVKMRLGYTHQNENYISLALALQNVGVKAIALHGRTRSDMYEGKADWQKIKDLHAILDIPLIGNGDIKTVDDYITHKEDADAIMIGRGVVGNPFLIKEIDNYTKGIKNYRVGHHERIAMCIEHSRSLIELYGEKNAMAQMRGIAPHYIVGLPSSAAVRGRLSQIKNYDDLTAVLNEYEKYLDERIFI